MTPRKTMGETPWDAVVPPAVKAEPVKASSSASPKPKAVRKGGKERLTVHLPVEVIERAKNAVYWSPGVTLAGLAETAFLKALERMEKENGGPFPHRKAELKGGRPIK